MQFLGFGILNRAGLIEERRRRSLASRQPRCLVLFCQHTQTIFAQQQHKHQFSTMTSRFTQQSARMLLTAASRRAAPRTLHATTLQSATRSRVFRKEAISQAFSTSRTSEPEKPIADIPIQLKASASSADRPSLISAVAQAVSASGGWLSQTKTNETHDIFVLENVGSEQLAAFHSLLESLMMDWNQSTQQFLEDCYFSLVNPQGETSEAGTTAVLQLNWK